MYIYIGLPIWEQKIWQNKSTSKAASDYMIQDVKETTSMKQKKGSVKGQNDNIILDHGDTLGEKPKNPKARFSL